MQRISRNVGYVLVNKASETPLKVLKLDRYEFCGPQMVYLMLYWKRIVQQSNLT